MYRMYLPDGDPYSVTVHAAVPCASTSTISGPGLSITTAGTLASFTLTARDAFSNLRDTFHDEAYGFMYKVNCFYLTPSPPSKRCYIHFSRSLSLNVSFSQVNMRPTSLKTIRPTHSDSGDGLHVMNFNITTAGSGVKGFDEFVAYSEAMSPLGNADGQACADYCATLFSDLTRYVTMQNLFHDGGFSNTGVSMEVISKFAQDQA